MPEWVWDAFGNGVGAPPWVLVVRLGLAFVLGCVVAGIYRITLPAAREQAANLVATLVLLTILIAMVTLVIGNSVARAFSLVGALAIVRFRTVVEDTRDTAFVIFAVAVGMAVGAGFLDVPLLGIPVAALAAILFRSRRLASVPREFILTVRLGAGHAPEALLGEAFRKHLQSSRLIATATARQGAAIEFTYGVRLGRDDGAVSLVVELNGLEGVQGVELRQA